MKPLISALALVTLIPLSAPAARAENVCMMADEMKAALIDWYGETPVSEPNETREQVWASDDTGTWTIIRTFSDGSACVLAQGEDWSPASDGTQMLAQLAE